MLTRDDLIDILIAGLARAEPAAASAPLAPKRSPGPAPLKGRPFLSEHDLKKRLTAGGRRLTIPKDAILSPLATDWIALRGIEIVRE